jgi:hypothetical protein
MLHYEVFSSLSFRAKFCHSTKKINMVALRTFDLAAKAMQRGGSSPSSW